MPHSLNIQDFMTQHEQGIPVLDVRSPGEFQHGRIPTAINMPLFNNEERAVVGTLYKQQGREQAIEEGLKIVGPKLYDFVQQAKSQAKDGKVMVHCWRGGMRSQSMATLLRTSGLNVSTLEGGYKAYRNHVQAQFDQPYKLIVLGGKTGCGKTDILHALEKEGEQVIDLEGLANHKGSSFGGIGQPEQPSGEMFENLLWERLSCMNFEQRIWVEDESEYIGKLFVPKPLFRSMESAHALVIELPMHVRVARLIREYGQMDEQELEDGLMRIQKRLGGQNVKEAKEALGEKNYARATEIALTYYDKAYLRSLNQRPDERLHTLNLEADQPQETAKALISHVNNTF